MKKQLLLITVMIILATMGLGALDINDPQDRIYRDIEAWQERGFFRHLPQVRPYPSHLLLELMRRVEEQGNSQDKERAAYYISQIDRPLRLDVGAQAEGSIKLDGDEWGYGGFLIGIKGMISPSLSLWSTLGGNAIIGHDSYAYYTNLSAFPYGDRPNKDFVDDTGKVGPFNVLQAMNASMSYGSPNLYVYTGLTRNSYGPLNRDGVVLSPDAPHAGRFEVTWWEDNFSYTMMMMQLVATDNQGRHETGGKYYFLHSYNWSPYSWLELSFFETVIGQMHAVYLLPFSQLFYSQGIYGFDGNSQMGFSGRINLPQSIEISGAAIVDDLGFNEIIKLNFDTKLKAAGQAAISWTPAENWLQRFSLDYTLVFPYMYTHEQYAGQDLSGDGYPNQTRDHFINYTNYTHNGENLAVSLSPNSDRIYGEFQFSPHKTLDIFLTASYVRHGNGSVLWNENLADPEEDNDSNEQVIHDGSIFDDGVGDSGDLSGEWGLRTFDLGNRFLKQDVLEKVLQLGLGVNADLSMPFMDSEELYRMELDVQYIYEHIWNSSRNSSYGVSPVEGAIDQDHYLSVNLILRF